MSFKATSDVDYSSPAVKALDALKARMLVAIRISLRYSFIDKLINVFH